MIKKGILLVTGSYYPEITGGNLQCKKLIKELKKLFFFYVITFTKKKKIYQIKKKNKKYNPKISRLFYSNKFNNKLLNIFKLFNFFLINRKNFSIVHIYGISNKNIIIILLSKLFQKKVIVKFSSYGEDDMQSIFVNSKINFILHKFLCDIFVSNSISFLKSYKKLNLNPSKIFSINNFLLNDSMDNKIRTKKKIFQNDLKNILFVGHFSNNKRPWFAYTVWKQAFLKGYKSNLIFIGQSSSQYYEVDASIKKKIIQDSIKNNLFNNVLFINFTNTIEKYYNNSNILLMTSIREGMPNNLIEGIYFGLNCLATKIHGVTDTLKYKNLKLINKNMGYKYWSIELIKLLKKENIIKHNLRLLKDFDNNKTKLKYENLYLNS